MDFWRASSVFVFGGRLKGWSFSNFKKKKRTFWLSQTWEKENKDHQLFFSDQNKSIFLRFFYIINVFVNFFFFWTVYQSTLKSANRQFINTNVIEKTKLKKVCFLYRTVYNSI